MSNVLVNQWRNQDRKKIYLWYVIGFGNSIITNEMKECLNKILTLLKEYFYSQKTCLLRL